MEFILGKVKFIFYYKHSFTLNNFTICNFYCIYASHFLKAVVFILYEYVDFCAYKFTANYTTEATIIFTQILPFPGLRCRKASGPYARAGLHARELVMDAGIFCASNSRT